jgi:hypothetical protein
MNLAKIIGTGALLLTLGASLAYAIDPKTEIGKEVQKLLSSQKHENVLHAVDLSKYAMDRWRFEDADIQQQTVYEISMLFAESGNPANALRCSDYIDSFDKKYEVAEALIKSGNPRNGVECLKTLPREYAYKGLGLLYDSGNRGNYYILNDFLSHEIRKGRK